MISASIWIRDLLVAIHELTPSDDKTRDAIADVLGFERALAAVEPPSVPDRKPPQSETTDSGSAPSPRAASLIQIERLPPILPRTTPSDIATKVAPLRLTAEAVGTAPTPVPLFSPLAGRFIVQELISSSRFGPEPDLERVIAFLVRYEIPQPLPLQERRTLARGVQILVDDGEGMEPFTADQQGLVDLIRRLVGDALKDVRSINEAPDPADVIHPWEPPPPGTPVLALTDLGLGGRVERTAAELESAWRSVASILAARGSSLVALIPYHRDFWPARLRACMRLVPWDRPTTATRARLTRRDGDRR
jgi:hypothetical protein